MAFKDEFNRLPLRSKAIVGVAGILIVCIIVGMSSNYMSEKKVEANRAALPGRCFDLPPMKEAKIQRLVNFARGRLVETVQTDAAGAKSVVFVPMEIAEKRLRPCGSSSDDVPNGG
ncbi:hypothetical protein [Rhizobium laguerreae]|uniref:hypothetical protein n=1 Tax=Rhizobium laguerreae TaxID=1076926 RepID=UPI001C90B4BF|nr:hypothetical protein [Rhizobium laguerreae]